MTDGDLDELDIQVHLVSIGKESDEVYFSKKEQIDPDLRKWIKESIRKELNKLKVDNEGDKKFYVSEYSHELTKPDYIAELIINEDVDVDLYGKIQKLFDSLMISNEEFLDKDAKFQVISVSDNNYKAYFIYYRGIKVSALERKSVSKIQALKKRGNELVIQDKDVIEFGGKIELFIFEDRVFINNPRTLEYAFMYNDHIMVQRDKNLAKITSMSFFDSGSNTQKFIEKSSQYILSRGLASIKEETLEALEESFDERWYLISALHGRLVDSLLSSLSWMRPNLKLVRR